MSGRLPVACAVRRALARQLMLPALYGLMSLNGVIFMFGIILNEALCAPPALRPARALVHRIVRPPCVAGGRAPIWDCGPILPMSSRKKELAHTATLFRRVGREALCEEVLPPLSLSD